MSDQPGLERLRSEVRERQEILVESLKTIINYKLRRDDRLDGLTARAEDLSSSSYHFHGSARRVQRGMKWQKYKITIFSGKFSFFFICSIN